MSTAPINRDDQIKIMTTYSERSSDVFSTVIKDPAVQAVLFRNAFHEDERSEYIRSDNRVAKCG